jgi:hypothetical protein
MYTIMLVGAEELGCDFEPNNQLSLDSYTHFARKSSLLSVFFPSFSYLTPATSDHRGFSAKYITRFLPECIPPTRPKHLDLPAD